MTVRRDKARGWLVDISFKHADGRKRRVKLLSPVQSKRGAEQYEHQVRQALLDGTFGREEVELPPTVKKFADEFIGTYAASNNKASEVEGKRSSMRTWIVPELGSKRVDEVGLRDVEALKAKMLRAGRKASRVNNVLTHLNRMLKYAVEIGIMESSPRVMFVPRPATDFDFLDFDELARLIEAATTEPRLHAAIVTAADAGLRMGELCALRWTKIDFVSRYLTVSEAFWRRKLGTPKANRVGKLSMTGRLHDVLKGIRHLRGQYVFCDDKGEPWTRDWMDDNLKRICRKAGLREITWHVLRHTFCSHLAMQGAPAKAIMELARHTSLGVTQRYMHLSPECRLEAISLLDARPNVAPIRPREGSQISSSLN